jgi:hypothetical protein
MPSERDNDPVRRAFAPLLGLPAWLVRRGHGSFVTLEFGAPHIQIREPIASAADAAEQTRTGFARRRVVPRGDWHRWIYCCHWSVSADGKRIAWSEASDAEIDAATDELDGRLLTDVGVDPTGGASKFSFEDGVSLQTWPYDDSVDEQWMLYAKSGDVFGYRSDGCVSFGSKDQAWDDKTWQPLRQEPAAMTGVAKTVYLSWALRFPLSRG